MCYHFLERKPCDKTNITRPWCRLRSLRLKLFPYFMQINLLLSKLQCFTTIVKRYHPHSEHLCIKVACCLNISHCQHKMVYSINMHSCSSQYYIVTLPTSP